jgi:hypothetical protein
VNVLGEILRGAEDSGVIVGIDVKWRCFFPLDQGEVTRLMFGSDNLFLANRPS